MSRAIRAFAWMAGFGLAAFAVCAARAGEPGPDQPKQPVAELEDRIRKLEEIIEGTAHPVNLGRTSLAAVTASAVNGGRGLDCIYSGVLNAFDDGANLHHGHNYSRWLSNNDPSPWVEVRFDHPVTVMSVAAETAPPFTCRFRFAKGGEELTAAPEPPPKPDTTGRLKELPQARVARLAGDDRSLLLQEVRFPAPLHGVTRVRLTFGVKQGLTSVDEIRIMGYVPPDVKYTEGKPRILVTPQTAEWSAHGAFIGWWQSLNDGVTKTVREDPQTITVTFQKAGVDLFRAVIRKSDGAVTAGPLVTWTSAKAAGDGPKRDE